MGHIKLVLHRLFWETDTTVIRVILALASLLFCLLLLLSPGAMVSPELRLMRYCITVMGGTGVMAKLFWAFIFFMHFAGVMWRLFDPKPRTGWLLSANIYGLVLWLVTTLSTTLSSGGLRPTDSLEWVLCIFSAWALFRTALKEEVVTP